MNRPPPARAASLADKSHWPYGSLRILASQAGISPVHLSDILHRRKGASLQTINRLAKHSGIPAWQWIAHITE